MAPVFRLRKFMMSRKFLAWDGLKPFPQAVNFLGNVPRLEMYVDHFLCIESTISKLLYRSFNILFL